MIHVPDFGISMVVNTSAIVKTTQENIKFFCYDFLGRDSDYNIKRQKARVMIHHRIPHYGHILSQPTTEDADWIN